MPLIKLWKNPDKSAFQDFGQRLTEGPLGVFENTRLETFDKSPNQGLLETSKNLI